jgi:HK97 gp10 family phage protein
MATQTNLKTNGFDEYLEKIARAGTNIDASVDKALLVGGVVIQEEMITNTPLLTGNLAEHIQIKGPERDGNYHSIEVGLIHDSAFTDAETARYGNAQEYGSVKNAAHPYIRPGMKTGGPKATKKMKESLIEDGAI